MASTTTSSTTMPGSYSGDGHNTVNTSSTSSTYSSSSAASTDPTLYSTPNSTTTTSTTSTDATYTPASAPARPITTTSSDIHTTNVGPPIHSTSSFTTNTGVASQPIDTSNESLARPSTGLLHAFKKMTLGGQTKDLEADGALVYADNALAASMDGTRSLHAEILRYQQAQQALQNATVAVANAFHSVLADETNPYAPVSAELLRQSQMHSVVPAHSQQLLDLTQSSLNDTDSAYSSIRSSLNTRKTKASDVQYYRTKVAKLTTDHEAAMAKGNISEKERERLDRNIGKLREIEMQYNAENENVIGEMNALWRRRVLRLGPALSAFLLNGELIAQEQLQMFSLLSSQSRAINPDVAHNRYLSSSATMLVPVGAGYVDHRELINQAHEAGIRGEVSNAQRQLATEHQSRTNSVTKAGGSLETVSQETIIRSEEQMRITKERFVTERVRLRKVVGTEMVTLTVPVRKERIEVERIPVNGPGIPITAGQSLEEEQRRAQRRQARASTTVNQTNTGTSAHTANTSRTVEDEEEVFEMIVSEERARVITEVVPIERVRLRKLRAVDSQFLEMDLLREHIDFSSPRPMPGVQGQTVTMAGGLQTVAGQHVDGFTDSTKGHVRVVNQPAAAAAGMVRREAETVRADVDDLEAMNRVGYGDQKGAYGHVNTVGMVDQLGSTTSGMPNTSTTGVYTKDSTVGSTHPYYNSNTSTTSTSSSALNSTATPGTTNTFDHMAASSDLTTTPSTTTTAPVV